MDDEESKIKRDENFESLLAFCIENISRFTASEKKGATLDVVNHELEILNTNTLNLFINNQNRYFVNSVKNISPIIRPDVRVEKKISIIKLSIIIIIGYLVGGFLSPLLDFVHLGGEIIRPITVILFVLLADFMSSNKTLTNCVKLFLGALMGIGLAKRLMFSTAFSNLQSNFLNVWRQSTSILSSAKTLFMIMIGAFVFCCDKSSVSKIEFDFEQIKIDARNRYTFYSMLFDKLEEEHIANSKYESKLSNKNKCPMEKCALVNEIINLLPFLADNHKRHLEKKIAQLGFRFQNNDHANKYIVWDEQEHGSLYMKMGFINNGDKCIILQHYLVNNGTGQCTEKGVVEKID